MYIKRFIVLIEIFLVCDVTSVRRSDLHARTVLDSGEQVSSETLDTESIRHLESIGFRAGIDAIESANKSLHQAKEKVAIASRFDVRTTADAKKKWDEVKSALGGTNRASTELGVAVDNFTYLFKNISDKIHRNSLDFLVDGEISASDSRILYKVGPAWNVTQDLLSVAQSMRVITNIGDGVGKTLRTVQDLAGFADDAETPNASNLLAGSLVETNSSSGESMQLRFDIKKQIAWFSNVWKNAKANMLTVLLPSVMKSMAIFTDVAHDLEQISVFLAPLTDVKWDWMNRIAYFSWYGTRTIKYFKDLGVQWKKLVALSKETMEPLVKNVSNASTSFSDDANNFEPGQIPANRCDWTYLHLVDLNADVDETSMDCLLSDKKACWCLKQGECYVAERKRFEPKEKVRCFTPVEVEKK